jgi:FMN-dependent NADH-azoreductase
MCDWVLEGAGGAGARTEKVYVPSLDIHPCQACNACFKTGVCVQKDDMPGLLARMLAADGVILAAPIFSMNLAAQAKIMIDRLQCCYAKKYVLKEKVLPDERAAARRGLWLSTGGLDRADVFEPAKVTVKYFFAMIAVKQWDTILYHNVDEKGAISDVPGAREACLSAGAEMVGSREGGGD